MAADFFLLHILNDENWIKSGFNSSIFPEQLRATSVVAILWFKLFLLHSTGDLFLFEQNSVVYNFFQ